MRLTPLLVVPFVALSVASTKQVRDSPPPTAYVESTTSPHAKVSTSQIATLQVARNVYGSVVRYGAERSLNSRGMRTSDGALADLVFVVDISSRSETSDFTSLKTVTENLIMPNGQVVQRQRVVPVEETHRSDIVDLIASAYEVSTGDEVWRGRLSVLERDAKGCLDRWALELFNQFPSTSAGETTITACVPLGRADG